MLFDTSLSHVWCSSLPFHIITVARRFLLKLRISVKIRAWWQQASLNRSWEKACLSANHCQSVHVIYLQRMDVCPQAINQIKIEVEYKCIINSIDIIISIYIITTMLLDCSGIMFIEAGRPSKSKYILCGQSEFSSLNLVIFSGTALPCIRLYMYHLGRSHHLVQLQQRKMSLRILHNGLG